jgi:hypothetical protein
MIAHTHGSRIGLAGVLIAVSSRAQIKDKGKPWVYGPRRRLSKEVEATSALRMDLDDHGPAEVEKAVPHHGSLATNGTSSELPWVEK